MHASHSNIRENEGPGLHVGRAYPLLLDTATYAAHRPSGTQPSSPIEGHLGMFNAQETRTTTPAR